MLLYRALNLNDVNDLENNNDIKCSLIRTHKLKSHKNHQIYFDLCILKEREYALDVLVGHIAGNRLRVGLSPWISTTKDFFFACSEYAVPQAGAYNEAGIRKPVIIIETDNVLLKTDEVTELRKNITNNDIIIDVSDGNLNRLYKNAFLSEIHNEKMPGFDPAKHSNYELYRDNCNVNGLSNYALYAKEVLFFKQIRKEDIKCIIYPMLQDVLYGCNVDIEKNFTFIKKNINEIYKFLNNVENLYFGIEKVFFKNLYPDYKSGKNLTDYLYNNYNNIYGNNIYEKYEYLKQCKREILKKITFKFNELFNYNLQLTKIIDDDLLVVNLDNPININRKQINDLLILETDGNLYKYNSSEKKYIYGEDKIDKVKVLNLTSTKK